LMELRGGSLGARGPQRGDAMRGDGDEEEKLRRAVDGGPIPRHIAVIMDGNGRWARARGLPREAGHRAGVEALRAVVRAAGDLGVKYLSLFAFSTENWKRPRREVDALMTLLVEYLRRELGSLHENRVRVRVMGRTDRLPEQARAELAHAVETTRTNDGLTVLLALDYGARAEIAAAASAIAEKATRGELEPSDVDEDLVAQHLYTAGIPDPDLLIRPSGEVRISNFLLWQAAYAELWFTPVLWPDFKPAHLYEAVREYQRRDRRFGGVRADEAGSRPC